MLDMERIVFIGRIFREYSAMLALDEASLGGGPVLDCPAGAASFAAEAHRMGIQVTACDVLYGLSPHELHEKGKADISYVFDEKFDGAAHFYTWEYYRGKDDVVSHREKALELFAADFASGRAEGRYVRAELPSLPFPDGAFRLALSSNFLFLYGDRLDFGFHVASLKELLRVSREVRVFPLQGLDAKPSPYVERTMKVFAEEGVKSEIVNVPFEFQRGANMMLRLVK